MSLLTSVAALLTATTLAVAPSATTDASQFIDGPIDAAPAPVHTAPQPEAPGSPAAGLGSVQRIAGPDRIATSLTAAKLTANPSTVIVVNANAWADAMVAVPFAKDQRAPIVLTGATTLDTRVADYLREVAPRNVIIVGGDQVVSRRVEQRLNTLTGATITRLAGATKVETAAAVASAFTTPPSRQVLVHLDAPKDAYQYVAAAMPLAVHPSPAPIVYPDPAGQHGVFAKADDPAPTVQVAANPTSIDQGLPGERIVGPIDHITSTISATVHPQTGRTVVVGQHALPDMLTAGSYLAANPAALVMVSPTQTTLPGSPSGDMVLIGGTKVVSAKLESQLTPTPVAPAPVATPTTPAPPAPLASEHVISTERGVASWYTDTQTASGQPFSGSAMMAAHKHLPFGSVVRVTNERNGKQVVVKINDRGPFVPKRVIDLTKAAADAIDMTSSGIAPVKLEVLERGPGGRWRPGKW